MEFDYTDIFGELWNKYALGCNTSFTDSARLTAKYVLCSYFLGWDKALTGINLNRKSFVCRMKCHMKIKLN